MHKKIKIQEKRRTRIIPLKEGRPIIVGDELKQPESGETLKIELGMLEFRSKHLAGLNLLVKVEEEL